MFLGYTRAEDIQLKRWIFLKYLQLRFREKHEIKQFR